LLAIDESQSEAVGEPRAKLFHEVESEGWTISSFGVKESYEGIESCDSQCGNAIMAE